MTRWICARCAVEYPDSVEPPGGCLICIDERECVEPPGQRWTTLADLERDGHHGSLREVEPRLFGIKVEPTVGIRRYDNFGGRVGPVRPDGSGGPRNAPSAGSAATTTI